jgi:hypothetical protein
MNGDIAEQPLARAVLRHLAATPGKDDPMGSLARTVLTGEAGLRTAASDPRHSQGLATAMQKAIDEQNGMTPQQRAAYESAAQCLRTIDTDTDDPSEGTFTRWRLAAPCIVFSALFLFGTILGAWDYWSGWTLAERLITVFLGVMFAANLDISISIGTDRKIQDVPWLRIGTIAVLFALRR